MTPELAYLLCACLSSTISRCITHPLDTLRIRAQAGQEAVGRARGGATRPATSFAALYRGLGVSLSFSVPGFALYLTTYDLVKAWLLSPNSPFPAGSAPASADGDAPPSPAGLGLIPVHLASALAAEAVSGLMW
jgi:hypothetical protein